METKLREWENLIVEIWKGIKSFFYESKIFVKKQFHINGTALIGIHHEIEIGRIKIRQLALPCQKAFSLNIRCS